MAIDATARTAARAAWRWAAGVVAPEACAACGEPVAAAALDAEPAGALCGPCWRAVAFITEPMCPRTGAPLPYAAGRGAMALPALATGATALATARAGALYRGVARDLALRFKHGARMDAGRALARWAARAGRETLAQADYVVAPPSSWRRLIARGGWDPAATLAEMTARRVGVLWAPGALRVARARPKQGAAQTRAARLRNLRGAFAVSARWKPRLAGKRVAVVDDVITTGATMLACARALRRAGAVSVVGLAATMTPLEG